MTEQPNIADAVRRMGGLTATAKFLVERGLVASITPQSIFNWVQRGHCPPEYALVIEQQTKIPREYLIDPKLGYLFEGICDEIGE